MVCQMSVPGVIYARQFKQLLNLTQHLPVLGRGYSWALGPEAAIGTLHNDINTIMVA